MISSLFIAHGAPNIIYDSNQYTDLLKNYADSISKPKAIIIFSAHWESRKQLIGTANPYNMIYDFYGFEDELYKETYTAGSDMGLANKIKTLLKCQNIESSLDPSRGIDHGAWTVLKLLYPRIDVPVVTMSVNPYLSNEKQYNIGKALEPLKRDDILIIGSGGIVHNLMSIDFYSNSITPWAQNFNNWIHNSISNWDKDKILNYEILAPDSKLAVPRNEHFIPLLILMGTGASTRKSQHLINLYQFGSLSLDIWRFS